MDSLKDRWRRAFPRPVAQVIQDIARAKGSIITPFAEVRISSDLARHIGSDPALYEAMVQLTECLQRHTGKKQWTLAPEVQP